MIRIVTIFLGLLAAGFNAALADEARVEFQHAFAPSEGMIPEIEKPWRAEICLNGSWQFQPVPVPHDFKRGSGTPPDLAQPQEGHWESTPLKVPSPWNVNDWGTGPDAGVGTGRPFAPDSLYYPSYPASWIGVEMGWLKRSFDVPGDWAGRRIVIHFEAVAGDAQVFINGQLAGEHFDSFLPFDFDVTKFVKAGGANELLVGVRKSSLYNIQSPNYPPGQQRTYPNGSNMDNLVGIWNDVYLWALPAVRVSDVFIQPQVDKGTLQADITVRNDTAQSQTVKVGADVAPWINLAGTDTLSAPEPKWKLDAPVLHLAAQSVTIPPGDSTQVSLQVPAGTTLKRWSPRSPNLYGLTAEIDGAQPLDRKYTRFGWRQFHIDGKNLLLNGQPIQLFSDFGHPFGPFVLSRRYVWQDYKMIKEMGGNSVRPHANVMPRFWLDLADEMGICVIDESSIFGSSIALNLKEPVTWTRLNAHVDGLVLRDRNHPSVFGWSAANEMFALFFKTAKPDRDAEYAQLKDLAQRPRKLDPTRDWISMDGDQDLEGTLPVWSRHMGIGLPNDLPADLNKPLMIGEHGGTYYAAPPLLAPINGDHAFESYAGRNEALGCDLYRMITQVARPKLAFFSASEMVWFGLEQLPFGYRTDARLPDKTDGVFFPNYVENVPGVQIERMPPYVTTLNPGFDPALPPFKPMAMYDAMKAAIDPRGPQPCAWDKIAPPPPRTQPAETDALSKVAFVGDRNGKLFSSLYALGVPLAAPAHAQDAKLLVIDGETVDDSGAALAKPVADAILQNGGLVWVMVREHGVGLSHLASLLPAAVTVSDRTATLLDRAEPNPAIDGFNLADLYFVADSGDCLIQKAGLGGPLVAGGHVLLTASNTDWTLFQRQPEVAKCGAMLIGEHLKKSDGAALVEVAMGKGRLWISTLDPVPTAPAFDKFWTQLWHNTGVKMAKPPLNWIVPLGADAKWSFSTAAPSADWKKTVDPAWSSGPGAFGNPDGETPWTSTDIYLSHTFDLPRIPDAANLKVRHSGDVEVFINGVPAGEKKGAAGDYQTVSLDARVLATLKPSGNVIAIHCRQGSAGNFVDAGLSAGGSPDTVSGPTHDLLLDGPMQ